LFAKAERVKFVIFGVLIGIGDTSAPSRAAAFLYDLLPNERSALLSTFFVGGPEDYPVTQVVCRPQIERELEGAHQLKAFRDVLHRSLVEEVGVAAGAAGPVSGVSVHNHLGVGAARDGRIADEIKA